MIRELQLHPIVAAAALTLAVSSTFADDSAGAPKRILRISADPNNLPFTNDRKEGFENRIAEIVAKEIGVPIEYNWRAQRPGFFRHTFKENEADLVLGVPAGFDLATTTSPYYRSSYVFITRTADRLDLKSFDDPRLKKLKLGVQLVGDDGVNTPPAHALAFRGIVGNLVGFTLYGDYERPSPPSRVIESVARKEVDAAIAWGPMANYFARLQSTPLTVTVVEPRVDRSGLPMTFAIAMGVRKGNKELRNLVEEALKRRKPDIEKILDEFHVPRVAAPPKGEAKR